MTAPDKHEKPPAMTLSAATTTPATVTDAQATIYSPVTTDSAVMANNALLSNNLPGLPVEVREKVASYSQLSDLANMRLTCKSLCIASTPEFAFKFPSERRFVLTAESLEGLMKMTAHPIIGPRFTKISFSIHRIAENDPQDTRGAFEQHKAMLTQALINLRKCKNFEATLGIFDEAKTNGSAAHLNLRLGHGYSKSYGSSAPSIRDSKRSLSLIFEAAAASNYPFYALEIDFISIKSFADRSVLPFIIYGSDVPAEVSATVFRPERNICLKHSAVSSNPIESTLRFDPSCGLLCLTGSCLSDFNGLINGLLRALNFTPFKNIILQDTSLGYNALLWIRDIQSPLNTLELMRVEIKAEFAGWLLFFCTRATFLQCLVLYRVVLEEPETSRCVLESRYVKWEGQQAIQAGLTDFILKQNLGYTDIDEDV